MCGIETAGFWVMHLDKNTPAWKTEDNYDNSNITNNSNTNNNTNTNNNNNKINTTTTTTTNNNIPKTPSILRQLQPTAGKRSKGGKKGGTTNKKEAKR